MKAFFTAIFMCLVLCHLSAQDAIVYPYNPDADNDELVGVTDLLPLLSVFGEDFEPGEIVIDGVALAEVLMTMQQTIESLQMQVEALEASTVVGLNDYMSVDVDAHSVLLTGANFQVVNGTNDVLEGNALGNIIIGYNTTDSAQQLSERQGSHNLVLGAGNTYNGSGNLIGGSSNQSDGDFGIVSGHQNEYSGSGGGMIGGRYNISSLSTGVTIGGRDNTIDSDDGVIVGGIDNENWQEWGVLVGGSGNLIQTNVGSPTRATVICGGKGNTINDGNYSAIFAGENNTVSGELAAAVSGRDNTAVNGLVVGGDSNTVDGDYALAAGGLSNYVQSSWNSILGGQANEIQQGTDNCVLVGGQSNTIQHYTTHSAIVGGQSNLIGESESDSRFSVVSGGRFNHVKLGYANSIFGGIQNTAENVSDSVLIGDPNITGLTSNRSIFGGTSNTQRGGFGSSIVGGRFLVAEIRSVDDVNYYPTDCLIGSSGRAFVGSTTAGGGNLIETSFGEGDD